MTEETSLSLKELQELDLEIEQAQRQIDAFEPRLEEIAEAQARVEAELTTLRSRLQELKLDERRLSSSADEKRGRMKRLQDRLSHVRNLREEAAVHAEADIVRRAIEADEQEALSMLDYLGRTEDRETELVAELERIEQEVAPQREALLAERAEIESRVADLRRRRDEYAQRVEGPERALYERIKAGGKSVAVSDMTQDGACGHCFAIIPLQVQYEIRRGASLVRCESCGVIVSAPADPAPEE